MARTWLSISVELLGGRGTHLWPHPGRIFAVGPAHTFEDLANSINTALARWDLNHLSEFTLQDCTVITNPISVQDAWDAPRGAVRRAHELNETKVLRFVQPGDEFQFVFDFGDYWVHRCTVAAQKIDPLEVLGRRPPIPLPYWGWGDLPDQYGRRWADDDGESEVPRNPNAHDPMKVYDWPPEREIPAEAVERVRAAIANRDADAFIDAMVGYTIDDYLTEFASAAPLLLDKRTDEREGIFLSFLSRLSWRGRPGDAELRESLLKELRGF